jgi:ankyrin repeat protein
MKKLKFLVSLHTQDNDFQMAQASAAEEAAHIDENGVGGQTPIFHAATQNGDWGLTVMELLLERGADLSVRVKLPGHSERPDEVVDCTPLEYAGLFPGGETKTVTLLRERCGAV